MANNKGQQDPLGILDNRSTQSDPLGILGDNSNKPTTTQTNTPKVVEQKVVETKPTNTPIKNPFEPTRSVNQVGQNVTEGMSGEPTQAPYFSKTNQKLKEVEAKKANIDNIAKEELLKKEYIQLGTGNARLQGKEFVFNNDEFNQFKQEQSKPKSTVETILDQAFTGVGNLVENTVTGLAGFVGAKRDVPIQVQEQETIIAPIMNEKSMVDSEYNKLQSTLKGNNKALEVQKATGKNIVDVTLDELIPKTESDTKFESTKLAEFKKSSADALNTIYGRMNYVYNENEDKFNALDNLDEKIKTTQDETERNTLINEYNTIVNEPSIKEYFALQSKYKGFQDEIGNRLKTDFASATKDIEDNKSNFLFNKIVENTGGKLAAGILSAPYRTIMALGGDEEEAKKQFRGSLDVSQGIQDYLEQNSKFTDKYDTPSFYNQTNYKGYKLLVDENGNAYSLRDENLKEVNDEKGILSEWNNLEKKTKVENTFNPYSTLATTSQVVADMAPLFAGGYVTQGSRAAATLLGGATIVAQTQNDIYDSVKDRTDLNEREKNAYAMAFSTSLAGLNMAVAPKFELNLLGATSNAEKSVLKKFINENAVKYASGEITGLQVAKEYTKYFLKNAGKEVVQELREEWLYEPLVQNAVTDITNKATGSNIEMQKIDANSMKDVLIPTVLATGLMSGLSSYRGKNELQLEALNDAVNNVDRFNLITDNLVANGGMDEVKATETKKIVSKIANTIEQSNVTDETDKRNLTNLLFQNETIRVRMDGNISDELKSVYKKQLADNQALIDKIINNQPIPTETLQEAKLEVAPTPTSAENVQVQEPNVASQKDITILEKKIELAKTLGEDVSDLENQLKQKQDAVQEQISTKIVLPTQQLELGLSEVEQGNEEPKVATEQSSQAEEEVKVEEVTQSESNPTLRDVESTAKTLEDINKKEQEELAKVKPILVPKLPEFPTPKDIEIVEEKQKLADEINAKREAIKQDFADKRKAAESLLSKEQVSTMDTKVDTKVEKVTPTEPTTPKVKLNPKQSWMRNDKVMKVLNTFTEPINLEHRIANYFISGGFVNKDSVIKEVGLKTADIKGMQSAYRNDKGGTIEELAEMLHEEDMSASGGEQSNYGDMQEYRDAIIDFFNTNTSLKEAVANWSDRIDKLTQQEEPPIIEEEDANYFENLQKEVDIYENYLSSLSKEQIDEIYKEYETSDNTSNQQVTSGQDTPTSAGTENAGTEQDSGGLEQSKEQTQPTLEQVNSEIGVLNSLISKAEKELSKLKDALSNNLKENQIDAFAGAKAQSMFNDKGEQQAIVDSKENELKTLKDQLASLKETKQRLEDSVNQNPLFQTKKKGKFETISKENFQKLIGKLKKAFPKINVNLISNDKTIEVLSKGGVDILKTKTGTIYGFVKDGEIYINEDAGLNANTPIHEFSHVWVQTMKAQFPNTYKNIIEKIKQEKSLIEQKRKDPNYSKLSDDALADEVLAEMVGNKGEKDFLDGLKGAKKTLIQQVLKSVSDVWKRIKDIFTSQSPNIKKWTNEQFQNATIEDIVNNVTADLLGGREVGREEKLAKGVTLMTLPNGEKVKVKNVNSEVVNGFYSNTENALAQVKQDKMSGNQWVTQLLSRGANKEEMKWTTLSDFLEQNKDKSISKKDIQQYLKDNRIEVVEVVKGAEEKQVKYKQLSDMPNAIYGFAERFIETGDKKFLKEIEKEGYTIHYDNNGEVDYFTKEGKTFVTDPTKFSQYQLEGEKENYAEKLVILPNKEVNISEFVDANADYIIETYKKSGKLVVEC